MRKYIAICVVTVTLALTPGCINTSKHQELDEKSWLTEQVEKGVITQEQADLLYQQLQEISNKGN